MSEEYRPRGIKDEVDEHGFQMQVQGHGSVMRFGVVGVGAGAWGCGAVWVQWRVVGVVHAVWAQRHGGVVVRGVAWRCVVGVLRGGHGTCGVVHGNSGLRLMRPVKGMQLP